MLESAPSARYPLLSSVSPLWKVVILAIIIRFAWACLIPVIPLSDAAAYDAFARTLANHGVFGWTEDEPFAFWPPGTSFFHAPMYALFGETYWAIVALNILLSAGIIVVSARIANRFFGRRASYVTALTMALWPTLIMYTTILASELPFLLLTIAALDVWTRHDRSPVRRGIVAGALLGLAALVRPLALLLPVVYGASLAIYRGITRKNIVSQAVVSIVALGAMAIVIAPWTWRNYQLYEEPVLISTNGGITLWMGNAPGTDGSYMYVPEEYAHLPDNEQAKVLGQLARQHILDNPMEFVKLSFRKLLILYANESIGVAWNEEGIKAAIGEWAVTPLKRFTQATWAFLLLMAVVGMLVSAKRLGILVAISSPLLLSVLYFSAVHSVIVAQDRYHLSFATQIAAFFSVGILFLHDRWRSMRNATSAASGGSTFTQSGTA